MTTNRHFGPLFASFLLPVLISGIILQGILPNFSNAASRITSDGTMGTIIHQNGNVYSIDGGTIKGTNLFESFGLFNLGTGDTASFNGPSMISNIIARVTGGEQSMIDGKLQSTINGANLYLLNPYGVLFGANASLDVKGSFHVSTADYLRMADGARFYADLGKQSTLSTAPVAAFGFLSNNPAAISIQGSDLEVPEGKTLSIIGGDIDITGGKIVAPSGRINIASVASPGEVIPVESRIAPDLQMSFFDRLGSINLSNSAYLDVSSSSGGGTVLIRGGKLLMEDSYIGANTLGDIDGAKKGIDIGISGSMEMENSYITSTTKGAGNSSNVGVNTGSLVMRRGSEVTSDTYSSGNAGDLEVKADQILLTEGAGLFADGHIGNGGNIHIKTNSLEMMDGAQIMSNTDSSGTCGNIKVEANSILLSGVDTGSHQTGIFSMVLSELATGAGGDIKIKAQTLEVKKAAMIATTTIGLGDAGKIEVNAESVLISGKNDDGYSASLSTSSEGSGKAGDIQITTHNLEINDDGYIDASSRVSANAGNISIKAPWITVANGGTISAATNGSGNGGNIQLSGNQIQLFNGATIYTNSLMGGGNAGDITITLGNTLLIENSSISAGGSRNGTGGNIQIKGGYMLQLVDGTIGAGVVEGRQTTGGGNIEVDTQYVILNDSNIIARAVSGGNGGNIKIKADVFLASPESWVNAESDLGINGTIDIRAPITNISGTLVPLQENFLSAEELLRDRCAARIRGGKYSSFVVSGRDGLPIRPGSVLPSPIY